MSERREGHNATRRQTMKRWKVALVAVLTIAMVMQSSNVQAIAEGIAEGLAGEGRPPITDTMLTDGTGTDEATGTDAATGTEDVTTDETAEDIASTEATTPETDEVATDTEATEEESTDAPAAPEEVVEDTTETEAPAEVPAEEADTTVTLNVEISGAKLTYKAEDGTEQNVTPETDSKSVDVPKTIDFKFTVTPDEGQLVSSVSYGETVLNAGDETGEYTVATADLTDGEKIVVTTEAVPAEEAPAEETPAGEVPAEEEPADGEETTDSVEGEMAPTEDETQAPDNPAEAEVVANEVTDAVNSITSGLFAIQREAPASIEVTQRIIGNDSYSNKIQLDLSELPLLLDASCASAPDLSDGSTYDFAYARVGKTDVASVNYDAGTDQLYLGIDGNSLSGIVIDTKDSGQIVLWYETHVGEYPVEYVVKCDGEPVDDVSTVGSLVGRNSIRDGETLQFAFSPSEGYEIQNVTATNGVVSGESGAYSLSSVTQETTVTIELAEKKTYNFTFHESSNTNFKGTNAAGETVEFSSSTQGGSFTYLRGDNISFTLKANMQNAGNSKALNKVTLSIGSYQNMALNIPTGNNLQDGASETTYLANGMVATVELTDRGYWEEENIFGYVTDSGYLPEFKVTISKGSCDAVRGDVLLSTNFKDAETQEVWAKDLVGTELTIAVHNGKTWPFASYEYKTLDPSKFEFATIHKDDTYVYVHVLPGFDADDVNLTVYVDGVANGSYELKELNNSTNTPKASDAQADGCQYYIVIPESENGKDIRISVVATSEERQFAAAFEDYAGAPGTLSATYSVGDSISVDDGRDVYPTQEGKVFQGWKIENDASGTVYLPGDPFTITSDNQGLAKPDAHGLYVYTFVPVWADADQAQSAPYGVNVYFEQDGGKYSETPNVTFSESGPYGQTAFLITEKLNEQLASEEGLPEGWQEGYEIDVEKSGNLRVEVTGNSSINIYYKKKTNTVSFKMVSGTASEPELPQAIKDMTPTEPTEAKYKDEVTFEGPAETSYYEAGRGTWKFQGWKIADQAVEGNKFTMPASDVEVVGTWTLEIIDIGHPDISVDYPENVPYDGTEHTWVPTVTDADGNVLVANRDYTVRYSTSDHTNVSGRIRVTITGIGNYTGSVERTYSITPLNLIVTADDITKYVGEADPALTSTYRGVLEGEVPGWSGSIAREPGEAVGTYDIDLNTLRLEDNPEGDFRARNYQLIFEIGTFTILDTPTTPDDGGDDTPTTPTTPTTPGDDGTGTTPNPTLAPGGTVTPADVADDAADDATTDDATPEETVTDDENPLASGDEEGIEDNGNPLASGRGDEDCWVHWLILVGMILTAVYFVGVAVRRRKFTADLLDYEDKVLGNNRNDA